MTRIGSMTFAAGVAALLVAATAGSALAAPSTPAFSWKGVYAGTFAGYGTGTYGGIATGHISGIEAGGFLGFNLQNGPGVVGLEIDGAWAHIGDGAGSSIGWITSFRGRMGWAIGDWLPFLQYGFSLAGVSRPGGFEAELHPEVGTGLQRALGDHLFLRTDYLFTWDEKMTPKGTTLWTQEFRIGIGAQF